MKSKKGKIQMIFMIRIYIHLIANFFAYPFLKWRSDRLGVENVANEFLALMKRVCVQDSFHHSFEDTYVKYTYSGGIYFYESTCNEGVLSFTKHTNKEGSMDINRLQLKKLKRFERFCKDVENNHSSICERWSLHHKNKQIQCISCSLTIIPDYVNHRTRPDNIQVVKLGIVFDHEFKIVSIIKEYHFVGYTYESSYNKDTQILSSQVNGDNSLEDELLLINLAIAADNSELIAMFPEYYMDTVFDYSTDEFSNRINLYHMINY
jgi:hypothetical protein